jgi:uncharacterized protein with PQ loop repeat
MNGSNLCTQGKVIKTKSVEYMPFFLSLVSFLNGLCWTAYALIRFDLYVTVITSIYLPYMNYCNMRIKFASNLSANVR